MTNRRRFIAGAGFALLSVKSLPAGAQTAPARVASRDLIIRSGPGAVPHRHDLRIRRCLLDAPPLRGVKLTSSEALFHTHEVTLTRGDLLTVRRGGTVRAVGGSHTFVIALATNRRRA